MSLLKPVQLWVNPVTSQRAPTHLSTRRWFQPLGQWTYVMLTTFFAEGCKQKANYPASWSFQEMINYAGLLHWRRSRERKSENGYGNKLTNQCDK